MTNPDSPTRSPAPPPSTDVVLNNLYELGCEALGFLIDRDREERRWKVAKRTVLGGLTVGAVVMWCALYGPMLGWTSGPSQESIAVVPIQGEIGGAMASAQALVPAIERACKSSLTKAVVLRISSPGGSPTEAERIAGALSACRSGTDKGSSPSKMDKDAPQSKPVIAVIEGMGASAAYLIAIQADEIHSTRYSMVGSIGAVMRSVDAGEALHRFGLKERVYASGDLKAGNSMWSANTPAQDALSQSLVDGVAQLFIEEVKARRGSKLKETPDMFSGRVWIGPEALRLGLVDGNTTFEALKEERFKDLKVHEFRPTQTLQDKLGLKGRLVSWGLASRKAWPIRGGSEG